MNKILCRSMISLILFMYGLLSLAHIDSVGDYIIRIQEEHPSIGITFGVLGMACAFSTFILWGLMLYHWGTSKFQKPSYKKGWFIAMSLGMFVGSWIYYFVVFEKGKTLEAK